MEQFVRDARIAMIYEGANGVQAMDLVGRKLAQNGGRALRTFLGIVKANIDDSAAGTPLRTHADDLQGATGKLQGATMWLMQHGLSNPDEAGAAAMPYLRLMALVAMGHMWLTMAKGAAEQLAGTDVDRQFLEAKLITARHFFTRRLPEASALAREISAGGAALMELPADAF